MIFVVLQITIAIIMDGYQTMIEFRQQSKASLLGDLIEFSFFQQLRRGLVSRLPFLSRFFAAARTQRQVPSKAFVIDLFDRAPQDDYVEFNDLLELLLVDLEAESERRGHEKRHAPFLLEKIVDHYKAWVPHELVKEKKRHMRIHDQGVKAETEMSLATQELRDMVAKMAAEKLKMQTSLDILLASVPARTPENPLLADAAEHAEG
eukprot:CAMPEP_0202808768 /NCGR_PEP_ID=MMETSP1389-20130828/1247_1 /ASSEMBLY_ACC=CAM_ASM_000865 /TAXON_ID=302021 /ORGANISM="Rhodomonas sp., Strain CCMP768" /LENGTH=205 /DNA_ID=CAMNT_0049479189 /DNA_START=10 /DNA_END=627 /DNA_ORIENTATION=-